MIKCNKCSIEKENNQYETYWHSTQLKFFTRRICRTCMALQSKMYRERIKMSKIKPEPPTNGFENVPGYKPCRTCKIWKNIETGYYSQKTGHIFSACRECSRKIDSQKSRERREEHLKENCGANDVRSLPGLYIDKYQEACVCELMNAMGWKYNDNKNLWYKEGYKTEDGDWVKYNKNLRKYPKKHPLYKK